MQVAVGVAGREPPSVAALRCRLCSSKGNARKYTSLLLARFLGVSFAFILGLPTCCLGALSISSGYEEFLAPIRKRFVCEEGDVVDEVEQKGTARRCDSMSDGPFCYGLPKTGKMARHRPFMVDSVIPQHIFGNPEAIAEVGTAQGHRSKKALEVAQQATATLNDFLENHYNPSETRKATVLEGRFDFGRSLLWQSTGLPFGFSRGLPEDILATWDGAWQALPVAKGGGPEGRTTVLVRLNGAVGTLRFSRPVVVRHLIVRPPPHATSGAHRLSVYGRKSHKEVWRSAYDHDGAAGGSATMPCAVGDLVDGRWAGDGRTYMGIVLVAHRTAATLRWLDDDPRYRRVSWQNLATPDGVPCPMRHDIAPGGGNAPATQVGSDVSPASFWRDLARRAKTVDEISFVVPFGGHGWLLAEVAVSVVQTPRESTAAGQDGGAELAIPPDPSSFMIQVHPGPRAVITEVSRAAVLYNSNDLVERDLRLRDPPRLPSRDSTLELTSGTERASASAASKRLMVSSSRSSEGFKQLLRALEEPDDGHPAMMRLPPHVRPEQFLEDAERLVTALGSSKAEVEKYNHFEAFFAFHWDWKTPGDVLQATFERWRRDPATRAEAKESFFGGQQWTGSYFCTQGTTGLSLDVTNVTTHRGQDIIVADFTFRIEAGDDQEEVEGTYSVTGKLQTEGRVVVLEPIPGSWKNELKDFEMTGLQGVVSSNPIDGGFRYAGIVPTIGCDSFTLESRGEAPPVLSSSLPAPPPPPPPPPLAQALADHSVTEQKRLTWNAALGRFANSLEVAQQRWRKEFQTVVSTGSLEKKKAITSHVNQLLEAAKSAGISIELSTDDGAQVVVKLGR